MGGSLNQLSVRVHQANKDKGFYDEPTEDGTRIALMHSEVSELLEANRKGKTVEEGINITDLLVIEDDTSFKKAYESVVKGTEEEEVADIAIRNLDWSGFKGVDLETHIALKLRYNSLRPHKHGKKY